MTLGRKSKASRLCQYEKRRPLLTALHCHSIRLLYCINRFNQSINFNIISTTERAFPIGCGSRQISVSRSHSNLGPSLWFWIFIRCLFRIRKPHLTCCLSSNFGLKHLDNVPSHSHSHSMSSATISASKSCIVYAVHRNPPMSDRPSVGVMGLKGELPPPLSINIKRNFRRLSTPHVHQYPRS